MPITIRIPDNAATAEEIRRLPANLERLAILRMSQVAYEKMYEGASRHTKPGAEHGKLLASTYNKPVPKGREVGHDPQRAPYAKYVVWPTRPHIIRPKDKNALRWVMGNRYIFAKFVRHPGYKGDNYLQRAADEAVRQMPAIINAAIKEA